MRETKEKQRKTRKYDEQTKEECIKQMTYGTIDEKHGQVKGSKHNKIR